MDAVFAMKPGNVRGRLAVLTGLLYVALVACAPGPVTPVPTAIHWPIALPTNSVEPIAFTHDSGWHILYVAHARQTAAIHRLDVDGGSGFALTSGEATDAVPAWSPDGQRVAFASNRDGNWEIYIMDADGGQPRNLSQNGAADYSPAWSPDGTRIAFSSDRDGNWEVYVMDSDGGNLRNLTRHPANDWQSAWSPDGHHLAFTSTRNEFVADFCSHVEERFSTWHSCAYNLDLFTVHVDTGELVQLTGDEASDKGPVWSPDGRQIAYQARFHWNWEIMVVNADGSHRGHLTDDMEFNADGTPSGGPDDVAPVWSPDGSRIAFANTDGDSRTGTHDIYVMNAAGGTPVNLSQRPGDETAPVWSPDGSRIAFQGRYGNWTVIYVMDADGGNQRRLTERHSWGAVWGPVRFTD